MYDFERLLINILILNFFLLLIPIISIRIFKIQSKIKNQAILMVSASLAIIVCKSIPVTTSAGAVMDFHWVAFIIGSLYGGVLVSLFLWTLTMFSQLIIEGTVSLYLSFGMLMLVLLSINFYKKIHSHSKPFFGGILSSISGLFVIFYYTFVQLHYIKPSIAISYFLLQMFTTVIMIYLIELIKESNYVNKKVINAEKMEVVSYLASSISHEVRNPLTVVKGFLQMLKQTDLTEEKKKEFIDISLKEVDRANDIIVSYLTFAKPASATREILDIRQELCRTINMITPMANMNCVEVTYNITPSYILGDSQLFQQCLLNITKNCIEAMPQSGTLLIETKEKSGQLIITITDSGRGMCREELSRLGEPYFTTKGKDGTGLGMMVVMRGIEILEGKLQVTSEVNKGTQFKITFPLVEKDCRKNA